MLRLRKVFVWNLHFMLVLLYVGKYMNTQHRYVFYINNIFFLIFFITYILNSLESTIVTIL